MRVSEFCQEYQLHGKLETGQIRAERGKAGVPEPQVVEMKMKRWKESGPQSLSKLQKTKSGATCELLQSVLIDDAVIKMSRVLSVDTASHNAPVPMICLMTCLTSVTLDNPTHCMLSLQRKVFHRPHCSKAVLGTEKDVLDARLIFTVNS